MAIITMIVTAAMIIAAVKFGLLRGIDQIAGAMQWSAKGRGQVTGFATSVPELVCLVAAGLSGVWDAGLWNIASSNIINFLLMGTAVVWFKQWGDLFNRRFLDEVGFATAAVMVPVLLMELELDRHWGMVPLLVGLFVVYRLVDRSVNVPEGPSQEAGAEVGSLPLGVMLAVLSLVVIAVVGILLGDATRQVVEHMGVHPAIAGCILGMCTSIPELISFFSVYQTSGAGGRLGDLEDTQEALDNLTSSNMANVGVVYPAGLAAYLLATGVFGA